MAATPKKRHRVYTRERPRGEQAREYRYTVIFEPDFEDGGWVATAPVLGVTTQGESLAQTRRMIQEAITGYLQGLREEGLAIPAEPRQLARRIRTEQIAVTA